MYRESSQGRLSSRSLSKIKNKVELAFGKPNNENQSKNGHTQNEAIGRSNSVKSIAKSKYESERNLPFSTAVKNGLMQSERKPAHQVIGSSRNKQENGKEENVQRKLSFLKQEPRLSYKNAIVNEKVLAYGWFHSQNLPLVTVCKRNKESQLRYFAIPEQPTSQTSKRILAAIEDGVVYMGNKRYMAIRSDVADLIVRGETGRVGVEGCDFVMVVDGDMANFSNLNRMVAEFYELLRDGVGSLDAVVSVLGRKAAELSARHPKNARTDIFLLILLMEDRIAELTRPKTVPASQK